MNLTLYITWILILARWVIAIQLTRVALRQKLPNLLWLAAFFYVTGTGDIFFFLAPITNIGWPFNVLVGLSEIVLVMFIHQTFYRDRKSPVLIFMVIAVVLLVLDIFFTTFLPYYSPFNWIWLIVVGYQTYKSVAADKTVEDWVKARYKLIVAYSVAALAAPTFTILSVVAMFVPAVADILYSTVALLVAQVGILAFTTLGIALEYLAWVMPEGYRRFLNRKYQAPAQVSAAAMEMSEEEVMRQFTK